MVLIIDDVRRIEKTSTVAGELPEVAPSADHTDGSWDAKDIYVGELIVNLPDGKLYSRDGARIIQVNMPDEIVTNMPVTNGSDSLKFTVGNGTYRVAGQVLTHSLTADEITITAGDVTNPRFDLITIDATNAAQLVTGAPASTPLVPATPAGDVLLAVIFVPEKRSCWNLRVANIRFLIFSEDSAFTLVIRSVDGNDGTSKCRSIRSSKGPEIFDI